MAKGKATKPIKRTLSIPGLQVALAVITALRTTRRTIAGRLFLVTRAGLFAAGALDKHATTLAVSNQAAFPRRSDRLFALSDFGVVLRRCRRAMDRTVEIRARQGGDLLAELLAQHARLHLLDRAFGKLGELERAVGHTDQPVHLESEMRHHVAHLAVLAFANRKHQPDIGALVALQGCIDRPVFDAVDLDALFQFVELALRDFAMSTDAVAAQPAGLGQFQRARQPTVIGEKQQTFGVEIEPADAD